MSEGLIIKGVFHPEPFPFSPERYTLLHELLLHQIAPE